MLENISTHRHQVGIANLENQISVNYISYVVNPIDKRNNNVIRCYGSYLPLALEVIV